MDKLLLHFGDEKVFMLLTTALAMYVSMFVMMLTLRKRKSYRKRTDTERAYELLLKGNEQQTLTDNAIVLVYKRMIAQNYEYVSYIDFLESFLLYVREKDEDGKLTNEISNIIGPILEKEKAEKPYSNVRERERRILLAIENSLNKGETISLKNNLNDLSGVIENNQKALDRARKTNKWTVPISIIGVLLTLFIWLYGSSLSNKDVERISNQIYSSIKDSMHITSSDSVIIISKQNNSIKDNREH